MMKISFFLFLGMLEFMLILAIIIGIQFFFLKKYRPYFLANTKPEMFLRKYIQYLIKHTRKFAKGFTKAAENGDEIAIQTRQNMTARLNWLILERDFAITAKPDIRYWEDINTRIQDMLSHWKEIKIIKEPPDLATIELALDDLSDEIDFDNLDIDEAVKQKIAELTKKANASSRYESMYNEMEIAYQTLEGSYVDLRDSVSNLKLEAEEAEKLKAIVAEQEANQQSLNAMMEEIEKSKERLNEELHQLEDAFETLETAGPIVNDQILSDSNNIDANEMVAILDKQKKLFSDFKKTLNALNMKPAQKQKVDEQTDEMQKTHKDINYSMQMLELARERLEIEVDQLNKQDQDQELENSEEDF